MKNSICVITVLIIFVMMSECLIVDFAEAEEESRIPEYETIEEIEEEIIEEEKEYWDDFPLDPLGYRDIIKYIEIPDEVWNAAVIWGMEYHIAPEFLCAIAYFESRYKNIKNPSGAYWGVMQIHPGSHRKRMERLGVTKDDLMDVSTNMRVAADYLHELFEEYEDPAIVLMKYNGDDTTNKTTSSYANRILEYSAELERIHGR